MEPTTPLPPDGPHGPDGPDEPRLTHRQRVILAVVGGLMAALVVALVAAALLSDDADDSVVVGATSSTSSTVPEETTTTVGLPTSTTAATTTTTVAPTTTTSTTQAPKPVVDGRGAILTAAAPSARREMTGTDCRTLAATGSTAECGAFRGKGNVDLAWLIESRTVSGERGTTFTARRAFVLRKAADNRWTPVLEARDDDGSRFTAIAARVDDVSGDGAAEVTFGFRQRGAANTLSVDVVEGPGTVVVHRDAPGGSARVSTGQLDLWQAAGDRFDHLTIRFTDNAWRIVANVKETAGQVPPSQL
jgi:hypothetical protein